MKKIKIELTINLDTESLLGNEGRPHLWQDKKTGKSVTELMLEQIDEQDPDIFRKIERMERIGLARYHRRWREWAANHPEAVTGPSMFWWS